MEGNGVAIVELQVSQDMSPFVTDQAVWRDVTWPRRNRGLCITTTSSTGDAQSLYVWRARHTRVTPVTHAQNWDMGTILHNTIVAPM